MFWKRSRRRLRTRLGLGGQMYLVVTVIVGTAALNSQTNLLFWIFGLMISVVLISLILGRAMLRGLSIQRLAPEDGAVDEPLFLRYQLNHRGRWLPAFGLSLTELDIQPAQALAGPPRGWVLHLGPRCKLQAEAIAWPVSRGKMRLDRIRLKTTFPFGILRHDLTLSQPGVAVVYPKMVRLHRRRLQDIHHSDPAGARSGGQGGGHDEFYGLRPYRDGDSIKRIDWKRSARGEGLVSRELTRLHPPRLMVLLDLRQREEGSRGVETAISFAASVICQAHMDGVEVGLSLCGAPCGQFPACHSRWHRTHMLHALGELNLASPAPDQWSPPRLADANWLVIHSGARDPGLGPPGAVHQTWQDLESWRAGAALSGAAPKAVEEVLVG